MTMVFTKLLGLLSIGDIMWISVKDKLPPLDKEVLVISCTNTYYLAWRTYYNGIEEWDSDECTFEDDYITHWQALPPLPREVML